jgi:D-amino-acid oxidase
MIVEPPIYLPAMLTDVRIAGGKVVVREMKSLDEVRGLREKLVFNCTGLGAKALFGDEELTPIRGQLTFLVPQPEVTYATSFENTYMFSRRDGVLLGGTHEMGDWNLQPDLTTKAAILAKQVSLFDGMRDC